MTQHFTADTHFGHKNILKHGRGADFATIEEHDEALINAWNEQVFKQDTVFILGDFSFYDGEKTNAILRRLNGQKRLIRGNHDQSNRIKQVRFHTVDDYMDLRMDDEDGERRHVVLSHFPMLSWHRMHYGAYHLHGHCHNNLVYPHSLEMARILDVGVDTAAELVGKYRPLAWEEVKQLLAYAMPVSVDHHQLRNDHEDTSARDSASSAGSEGPPTGNPAVAG